MAAAAAATEHAARLAEELSNLPASPVSSKPGSGPAAAAAVGAGGELNRCLVFCRLRPGKPQDFEDGAYQLIHPRGKTIQVKDERNYDFDGTFDMDCTQQSIFETVAVPALEYALKGHNCAILAYGQTGSGKSFTMVCTKPGVEGVIPRAAKWIFDKVASDKSRKYRVVGQAVQIYRDNLGDLLQDGGKEKVDIRYDDKEGVSLPGARSMEVASTQEFMEFYAEADKRRVVACTAMNPESSRGHSAFVLRIFSEPSDDTDCGARIHSKITFIDLAGYERFSKTGISNSDPIRKDEAKTINASLLALGHVVTSLSNGDKHIPWRNAKLTRLLQDSIGGTSRTTIMLTCGPSSEHLHESTNTLQFGLRAMAVKVQSKISTHVDYEKLAAKLQGLLDERDQKISALEVQLATHNAEREELQERQIRDEDHLRQRHAVELERMRTEGASADRIAEVAKLQVLELDNLREEQREELSYQQEQGEKEMKALLDEQAKLTRRKEEEARSREESRLKELESKLAEARGGDSQNDLERCLKQLAERDAVLVSRAGERARLQALCATLIQQVKQCGATPTHSGAFDENFLDIVQVEEIKSMLEMQVQALTAQATDLRLQLANVQEVATERANEVASLRQQLDSFAAGFAPQQQQQQQFTAYSASADGTADSSSASSGGAAADATTTAAATEKPASSGDFFAPTSMTSVSSSIIFSPGGGGGAGQLVDRSEVETVRTLMQVDIDMLNCKVKMLETQLSHAMRGVVQQQQPQQQGDGSDLTNNSFRNDSMAAILGDSPVTGRRRRNTFIMGKEIPAAAAVGGGGDGRTSPPPTNPSAPSTTASSNTVSTGLAGNNNNNNNNNPAASAKLIAELRAKLLAFETSNLTLSGHIKYLEGLVKEMGGVAMDAPPVEAVATVQNVVDSASEIAKAKNDEMEKLMALLDAREAVINDQAMQMATLSEDCRRAREQFPQFTPSAEAAASSLSSPSGTSPSHNPNQTKQFIELIRAARSAQRAAEEKLYKLQQRTASVKLADLLEAEGSNDNSSNSNNNNNNNNIENFLKKDTTTVASSSHFDVASSSVDSLTSPKYAPKSGAPLNSVDKAAVAVCAAVAAAKIAGASSDGIVNSQAYNSALAEEFAATLRMNDDRLLEAETRVIELEGQNVTLKRMVAALERQLEMAHMQPVCGLSKADRDDVETERAKDTEASQAAQEELQRQLQAQLDEKARIQSMLEDLSNQRAKDAGAISKMEAQLEEQKKDVAAKVSADRQQSQAAMLKLQQEAQMAANEARRLKQELEERDRRDKEKAEEAERIKRELDAAQAAQAEKAAESFRLRQELQAKQAESAGIGSEAEKLKKELEENTRAMMLEQAKKMSEQLEAKEGGGFFARIKNWKI